MLLQSTDYNSVLLQILGTEADYKVVIMPQSPGDDIVCGDNAVCNCTDDNYCSYFFKSISINDSYSAAVKVAGCVTEMITCDNVSSRKYTYMYM